MITAVALAKMVLPYQAPTIPAIPLSRDRISLLGEGPTVEISGSFPRRWETSGLSPTAMGDCRHAPTAIGNQEVSSGGGRSNFPLAE